jgi:catechol 2,3-dioxygenase-like lactoylglutathione lyase family enzyme
VPDVDVTAADLRARGLDLDGPFHFGEQGQTPGVHPGRVDYGTFASFTDPDGNWWLLQEIGGREAMKLELVIVPTADVERSKQFYEAVLGFTTSTDHHPNDDLRIVQLDPPGSACSITVARGIPQMAPGTLHGLHLVVSDIVAARNELVGRGLDISEPYHFAMDGSRSDGVDPNRTDYATFAEFEDPDGNTWLVQDVPSRAGA